MMGHVGKEIRLGRFLSGDGGRGACFAFDHGMQVGPIAGNHDLRAGISLAVAARFDSIILAPGALARAADLLAGRDRPLAIMRIDQTTMWRIGSDNGYPQGYTRQVAGVEEAAAMGADAVISYFFTQHEDPALESRSIEIAAETARQARRLGLLYVAEPMAARGGLAPTPFAEAPVAMNSRIAVEIGADVIKADWPGSVDACRTVVEVAAGAPVFIAGGPRTDSDRETVQLVADSLAGGARGVMFGRTLFQSPEPLALMNTVRAMIHEDLPLEKALQRLAPNGKDNQARSAKKGR